MNFENEWLGAGIVAAFAAALCCITPVLAVMAGIGGMASAFSFLEPFRPWMIGFTVLSLGFAWYQQFKPNKEIDCECEDAPSFFKSKTNREAVVEAINATGFKVAE